MLYTVILAGGSGTRLWPLSRELYPKQFLPLPVSDQSMIKNNRTQNHPEEGESSPSDPVSEVTLLGETISRVLTVVAEENILIVTHRDQAGEIKRRLKLAGLTKIRLLEEPEARNTAPAIGLAARFLQKEAEPDAVMAVLPSDHLIPDRDQFAVLLEDGARAAENYGLVTFGIRPTYPETGYGYICCGEKLDHKTFRVEKFVEKPDLEKAIAYLKDPRFLWNSGMFIFRVDTLMEQYRKLLPQIYDTLVRIDYSRKEMLDEAYHNLQKISIDYGILERSDEVTVIPADITWSDLGSWEAYYQLSGRDNRGNAFRGQVISVDTENSLIISPSRLTGAIGLKDLVIVDTHDALLVCDRSCSQDVKKIVDRLKESSAVEAREHRTVYRPWGSYTSLETGPGYQVKRINVSPGSRLSLQSHHRRAENWVVIRGEALVTIDDRQFTLKVGERAFIPVEARHRLENRGEEEMALIEVQTGDYLGEDDIERYEDDYGRIDSSAPAHANSQSQEESPARRHFRSWLGQPGLDPEMKKELQAMQEDPESIERHFGSELVFGTGGMRGIIGPGLNRINRYVIGRATQGLADYINRRVRSQSDDGASAADLAIEDLPAVAIACDTRRYSPFYAETAALVLAANGIRAFLFSDIRPTPALSFATRELGCAAGIVITASHNPRQYNGYKVYGPDGGQAVSPLVDEVIAAIKKVDIFADVKQLSRGEAVSRGLLQEVDPDLDRHYIEKVSALSMSKPRAVVKTVFTPLHGTGSVYIPDLLNRAPHVDYIPVKEQMVPDSEFSTVSVPNPEDPAALKMALDLAEQEGAELVLATDPDCDRVGVAARDAADCLRMLNGNQVGALLLEYICSRLTDRKAMPPDPVLVTTIVTGHLGRKVAAHYGLRVVETLTGFKFIGDKMKEFEEKGTGSFVFGYEESYGYLTGTFVRDKDAVIASMLIAEMVAYYKEQGQTLFDLLDELHRRHGYHRDELLTVELEDISQADRHVNVFKDLPPQFAGQQLVFKRDYAQGKGWNLQTGEEFALTLPRSPVLHYTLADSTWFAVRPSGTEPKVKFYLAAAAPDDAGSKEKIARLREAILSCR